MPIYQNLHKSTGVWLKMQRRKLMGGKVLLPISCKFFPGTVEISALSENIWEGRLFAIDTGRRRSFIEACRQTPGLHSQAILLNVHSVVSGSGMDRLFASPVASRWGKYLHGELQHLRVDH